MSKTASIRFYVNNELFAARSWRHVPRGGDEVMLAHGGCKRAFRVVRVVWGVEDPHEQAADRQAVNIEIAPAD